MDRIDRSSSDLDDNKTVANCRVTTDHLVLLLSLNYSVQNVAYLFKKRGVYLILLLSFNYSVYRQHVRWLVFGLISPASADLL